MSDVGNIGNMLITSSSMTVCERVTTNCIATLFLVPIQVQHYSIVRVPLSPRLFTPTCSKLFCGFSLAIFNMRVPHVPQRYVLPPSQRPNPTLDLTTTLPIIDVSSLHHVSQRSLTLDKMQSAFFQVVNHGIPLSIMNDALDAATEFFNLPPEEKMPLSSDNVHNPVRYGTSLNHASDKVHFWRDFIKHYSHPISDWIRLWQKEIEEGNQLMAINCYPACPEPDLTLGLPPHSDYGTLTILLQSGPGLQLQDNKKNWLSVPLVGGALIVQLGDQLEVMSNGQYKSVIHQVTLNAENKRLSIASVHSLPINMKIGPAPELVDEQHPVCYKGFSFKDFLDFISSNNIADRRFIDSIKKTT